MVRDPTAAVRACGRGILLELPDEGWFDMQLMDKDIRLALALADQVRVPLPSAAAADDVLGTADRLGYTAAISPPFPRFSRR